VSRLRTAAATGARLALVLASVPLRLVPRRRKIVMLSRQEDGVPEDFRLVVERLHERAPDVEVVVLARRLGRGAASGLRYLPHLLRQLWHVSTSRAVLLDTYNIVVSAVPRSKGVTVVQMWHGLGALKKFGYSTLDRPGGRSGGVARAMRMHANYDVVLVSGEQARAAFAEAFAVPADKVRVAPLPRTDLLRDPAQRARDRASVVSRFPELAEGVVLYAPTLHRAARAEPSGVDLGSLAAGLADAGRRLVVRLHPLSRGSLPEAFPAYDTLTTRELLSVAEAFVTDCSSGMLEAGVAGVPAYFLWPRSVPPQDLYLDVLRWAPGIVATSVPALVGMIEDRDGAAARESADFVRGQVELPVGRSATDGVVDVLLGAPGLAG